MDAYNEYIKPFFKVNMLPIMFWGGLIAIIVGAIFGSTIDKWLFNGLGQAILNGGSAVLGAGVFGAILKTSQYTKVFQKNIMDVMYSPSRIKEEDILKDKWRFLTDEMLKYVLPKTHEDATNTIEEKYLCDELDYHFESYKLDYDIKIDDKTLMATVTTTINAKIVIAANRENPIFEQKLQNDGENKLLKLMLNGDDILDKQSMKPIPEEENTYLLTFPFKDYGILTLKEDDRKIDFERVIQHTQNLRNDPCLLTLVRRYSRGFEIRAKVSDGYKLFFDNFGIADVPKERYWPNDVGYEKWQIAKPSELVLPGDGCNIVIMNDNI